MSSSVNRTFSFANNTRQVRQSCELKLETTPRNAQYSQRVTDLMRREEVRRVCTFVYKYGHFCVACVCDIYLALALFRDRLLLVAEASWTWLALFSMDRHPFPSLTHIPFCRTVLPSPHPGTTHFSPLPPLHKAALREGIEATEIFHGVDSLITSETRNIFAKITEQNCKKWNTFIKNTDGTCKRFVDEMRAVLRGSPDR